MKNLFPLLFVFQLFSCQKNAENQTDTISTDNKNDTIEVNYYPNKKIKDVLLASYKEEKNVKLYYSEDGILKSKKTNFNSFPQVNSEYNNKGKILHQWTEGDVGGCIGIKDKEYFWNEKGSLVKEILYNYTNVPCSEKVIIKTTTEYYENSKKIKLVKNSHESYEGSEDCPCGEWKNYNENGKLVTVESYDSCNNMPSCNSIEDDVISSKWNGKYNLLIKGEGKREGNDYEVNLVINNNKIILN